MDRSYLNIAAQNVRHESDSALFGELAKRLPFALEPTQTAAWQYQIQHLRKLATDLPDAHFFMEFLIQSMAYPNLPYNVKLIRAPASTSGLPADRPLMPYSVNRTLSDKGVL